MKRICVVLTIFALLFLVPCETFAQAKLAGQVVDETTGQPVSGVQVGVVRMVKAEQAPPSKPVGPERILHTSKEGRFEMQVPPNTEDIDRVAVFTTGFGHSNSIYKDVSYTGSAPTLADLRKEGVTLLDLTKEVPAIRLAVKVSAGKKTVMVPMRDGVKLATDIYLPDDGPSPAIVLRTPYDKNRAGPRRGAATMTGYAVVIQDARGRFASEGKDIAFMQDGWGELQDGYDTIEWVASQPWCNSKVGTMGGSALGITQVLTAGSTPPHLVCQRISVATGSLYHHAAYWDGVFRKAIVENWLQGNKFHPDNLKLILAHPDYDSYWQQADASTRSAQINVPGLFWGGWFDCFSQGTVDAFAWRQYDGGDGAKGNQKLVMGPWTHGGWRRGEQGELSFPPNGQKPDSIVADAMAWFDYWLKGIDNGIAQQPAVTYYVMGDVSEENAPGNEWRTSDVWPVPADRTPFYFHAGGGLDTRKPSADEPSGSYDYDPKNPVPTRGGNNLTIPKGPMDQRPVENRPDVLLFTSGELAEPIEVTGQVKVKLWASSSAKDTDFTAKLTDVYPDGRSILIVDGIIRARHRKSLATEELLTSGQVYEFEIDLWSTSLVFNKGHRIRVAISSSNFPRFDPNPNTGDPLRANEKTVVARNTIYHDTEHPSHILLPVVKRKD